MAKELYIGPDKNDVQRKLVDTICRYSGEPVYVRGSDGHILLIYTLTNMTTMALQRVDYRQSEFDYRSPPLGYVKHVNGRAVYLARIPERTNYRLGICRQVIHPHDGSSVRDIWASLEFRNCILGAHSNLHEAESLIETGQREGVPIARHIAIQRSPENDRILGLYYRGRFVGLKEAGQWRLLKGADASILEPHIRKAGVELVW